MHQMTTGASNDFERATEIARRMVTQWGMSDELGTMVYGENEGEVFLGRSVTTHKNVSEATMQKVDAEIRRIIDQQYALARKLLEENRDKVEAMTKALLEWETHRRRPDRRHHGRQAAAPAEARAARSRHAARRATAAPAPSRQPNRRRVRRTGRVSLACMLRCGTLPLSHSERPAGHGRGERHARFLLRRRPLLRSAARRSRTRAGLPTRAPTSSTSAASRPVRAPAPVVRGGGAAPRAAGARRRSREASASRSTRASPR